MPKQGTSWAQVEPGDIISFRYQSVVDKTKSARTSTILVLNVRFQKKLKNGDIGYYLNGMKLEGSNISVFTNRDEAWDLLTTVGKLEVVNLENEIYKVLIEQKYMGIWGAKQKLYEMLQKTPQGKKAEYRSYDWDQVRERCKKMIVDARNEITLMTDLPKICPDNFLGQMATILFPVKDHLKLKEKLFEKNIEIPTYQQNGYTAFRISIQGYNSDSDIQYFLDTLKVLL